MDELLAEILGKVTHLSTDEDSEVPAFQPTDGYMEGWYLP